MRRNNGVLKLYQAALPGPKITRLALDMIGTGRDLVRRALAGARGVIGWAAIG